VKLKFTRKWLWGLLPLGILAAVLIYRIPAVNARLSWRIEELRTRLVYTFNPPDKAVFVPGESTPLPTPAITTLPATPEPTKSEDTEQPTETAPGVTGTPLPDQVILDNVIYVDQHERWNYCGPANLAMALNYWGWPGDRDDIAAVVKPGINDPDLNFVQRGRLDKNVMPSEMVDFVANNTDYYIVVRYGGDLEILKELIANGYPVLVEKGYYEEDYTGKVAWLGHYLYTTGYDDSSGEFVVQDAYLKPGKDMRVDYQTYLEGWRSFDYLFMVIYPPADQEKVYQILGPYGNPVWSYQHALEIAEEEIQSLRGVDLFFAWFNKGTSLVKMEHYMDAAEAFDQAYQVYGELDADDAVRPYRITWYQTSPYQAYYFSGRYQDVVNLADFTFETIDEDTLEESLYWRGLAYYALGKKALAKSDLYNAVWLNPNFDDALDKISVLNFDE
jgi:tetratricopeptide (TPR) repeat protein